MISFRRHQMGYKFIFARLREFELYTWQSMKLTTAPVKSGVKIRPTSKTSRFLQRKKQGQMINLWTRARFSTVSLRTSWNPSAQKKSTSSVRPKTQDSQISAKFSRKSHKFLILKKKKKGLFALKYIYISIPNNCISTILSALFILSTVAPLVLMLVLMLLFLTCEYGLNRRSICRPSMPTPVSETPTTSKTFSCWGCANPFRNDGLAPFHRSSPPPLSRSCLVNVGDARRMVKISARSPPGTSRRGRGIGAGVVIDMQEEYSDEAGGCRHVDVDGKSGDVVRSLTTLCERGSW